MRLDYRNILKSFDSEKDLEYPDDFDRDLLVGRVRSLIVDLSAALGRPLPLEDFAQDASFYADIELSSYTNDIGQIFTHSIRVSNFGSMCSYRREDSPESETMIIDRLLEKHGFVLIPLEELEKPYDGKMSDRTSIPDWLTRYFDYF